MLPGKRPVCAGTIRWLFKSTASRAVSMAMALTSRASPSSPKATRAYILSPSSRIRVPLVRNVGVSWTRPPKVVALVPRSLSVWREWVPAKPRPPSAAWSLAFPQGLETPAASQPGPRPGMRLRPPGGELAATRLSGASRGLRLFVSLYPEFPHPGPPRTGGFGVSLRPPGPDICWNHDFLSQPSSASISG